LFSYVDLEKRVAPRKSSGCGSKQNQGAKFWLRVMSELKNRGVEDVLIAVVLTG
jgi:transposase-like protein